MLFLNVESGHLSLSSTGCVQVTIFHFKCNAFVPIICILLFIHLTIFHSTMVISKQVIFAVAMLMSTVDASWLPSAVVFCGLSASVFPPMQ